MDNAKLASALKHTAAEYINRESNRRSLITVTRVELDERGRHATIFVTVYPDNQAAAAIDFLGRAARVDFRDFIKKSLKIRMLPVFAFQQDPNIGGVGEAVPIE